MKKVVLSLLPFLVAFFGLTQNLSAQDTSNFVINDFSAEYYLSKNDKGIGQLDITETITATFPEYDQNHGIERALPKTYKENSLDLKIDTVTKESGQAWNYTTYSQNDNLVLRIGDADRYVRGEQTYVIKYSVSNVITFYDNYDELFWDVNGDQWGQVFENVSAKLTIDQSILGSTMTEKLCYTGSFGSTESNCTVTEDDGTVSVYTTESIGPEQTLSFVVGFQPGTFSKPPVNILQVLATIFALVASVLVPVITLFVLLKKWRKEGRDSKGSGIIVPEYAPPKNLNTVLADVILNERLSPKAVTAGILELCIAGYLKIYEVESKKFLGKKTDYEIELVKRPDNLAAENQEVISMLFSGSGAGTKLNISQQKNKLYTKLKSLSSLAETNVVAQGFFTQKPTKARSKFYLLGSIYCVLCGLAVFVGFSLNYVFLLLALSLGLTAVAIFIISSVMPARTSLGVKTKEHLLGLKDYMKLAEEDRIKTLQSPKGVEKTPVDTDNKAQLIKLYEKLLPYAVLFGIEKDWATAIAPLYQQPPEWFNSTRGFNPVLFSSALYGIQTSTTQSFSAPSSSGSSGFSGGGAGGGGGGGGGGGW
ncbi:DUF2207 domain-containing protein [Candidatus Saccharibacteria bacterium]|nr:DUF2207 domain-containing protein [Candidatus Saccharibacteria bacterium]